MTTERASISSARHVSILPLLVHAAVKRFRANFLRVDLLRLLLRVLSTTVTLACLTLILWLSWKWLALLENPVVRPRWASVVQVVAGVGAGLAAIHLVDFWAKRGVRHRRGKRHDGV